MPLYVSFVTPKPPTPPIFQQYQKLIKQHTLQSFGLKKHQNEWCKCLDWIKWSSKLDVKIGYAPKLSSVIWHYWPHMASNDFKLYKWLQMTSMAYMSYESRYPNKASK